MSSNSKSEEVGSIVNFLGNLNTSSGYDIAEFKPNKELRVGLLLNLSYCIANAVQKKTRLIRVPANKKGELKI